MGWIFWIWNHEGVGVWQIGGDASELGRRGTRVGRRRVLYWRHGRNNFRDDVMERGGMRFRVL